ncbi:MAG: hypothetical protein K2H19_04385 [Ruminococcus sp.]|nr:hypothetical protein [Ruminococcus sp.]
MKLIVKSRRKSRSNRRVYVDNHYQIIFFAKGKINKYCKKIARLHSKYSRTDSELLSNSHNFNFNDNTFLLICQGDRPKNKKIRRRKYRRNTV